MTLVADLAADHHSDDDSQVDDEVDDEVEEVGNFNLYSSIKKNEKILINYSRIMLYILRLIFYSR